MCCTPLKTVYSESLCYIMCFLLPNVGFRVVVQGEIITVSCVRPCSSGKPNDGILLADLTKACPCQLLQIGECYRETTVFCVFFCMFHKGFAFIKCFCAFSLTSCYFGWTHCFLSVAVTGLLDISQHLKEVADNTLIGFAIQMT